MARTPITQAEVGDYARLFESWVQVRLDKPTGELLQAKFKLSNKDFVCIGAMDWRRSFFIHDVSFRRD